MVQTNGNDGNILSGDESVHGSMLGFVQLAVVFIQASFDYLSPAMESATHRIFRAFTGPGNEYRNPGILLEVGDFCCIATAGEHENPLRGHIGKIHEAHVRLVVVAGSQTTQGLFYQQAQEIGGHRQGVSSFLEAAMGRHIMM